MKLPALLATLFLCAACEEAPKAEPEPPSSAPAATATAAAAKTAAPKPSASAAPAVEKPDKSSIEVVEANIDESLPDIPEGRSKPPTVAEWKDAPEVNSQGKAARPEECHMKIVREWLKVHCEGHVIDLLDMDGFGKEGTDYFTHVKEGKVADVVARLEPGQSLTLRVWRDGDYPALFTHWPEGAKKPNLVALGAGAYPSYVSCGG